MTDRNNQYPASTEQEPIIEISNPDQLREQAGAELRIGKFELGGCRVTTVETAKYTSKDLTEKVPFSEDSAAIDFDPDHPEILAVAVADGMGGHDSGEVASRAAVGRGTFQLGNPRFAGGRDGFRRLMIDIDRRVKEAAPPRFEGVDGGGTTFTGVRIVEAEDGSGKRTASYLAIGDTPLYLFRGGRLAQISREETLPDMMLREGKIHREEFESFRDVKGNVITNCLGAGEQSFDEHNYGELELLPGDVLFIASDGLIGDRKSQEPRISTEEGVLEGVDALEHVLGRDDLTAKEKAQLLREVSNKKHDDFTAVIIEIPGQELVPDAEVFKQIRDGLTNKSMIGKLGDADERSIDVAKAPLAEYIHPDGSTEALTDLLVFGSTVLGVRRTTDVAGTVGSIEVVVLPIGEAADSITQPVKILSLDRDTASQVRDLDGARRAWEKIDVGRKLLRESAGIADPAASSKHAEIYIDYDLQAAGPGRVLVKDKGSTNGIIVISMNSLMNGTGHYFKKDEQGDSPAQDAAIAVQEALSENPKLWASL